MIYRKPKGLMETELWVARLQRCALFFRQEAGVSTSEVRPHLSRF